MKPNKSGVWEWIDDNGIKRLMAVYNVLANCPNAKPYWRVYFWGGYYNINDETDPCDPNGNNCNKQEWSDRWGNFVGEHGSIPEEKLYSMPTEEQINKLKSEGKL